MLEVFPHKYSSRELRLPVDESHKKQIVQQLQNNFAQKKDAILTTLDGVHVVFPFGWTIIRASNTQAALSMRFESDTQKGLQQIMHMTYELLLPMLSTEAQLEFKCEMDRVCV